jgi:hypothetical protein
MTLLFPFLLRGHLAQKPAQEQRLGKVKDRQRVSFSLGLHLVTTPHSLPLGQVFPKGNNSHWSPRLKVLGQACPIKSDSR